MRFARAIRPTLRSEALVTPSGTPVPPEAAFGRFRRRSWASKDTGLIDLCDTSHLTVLVFKTGALNHSATQPCKSRPSLWMRAAGMTLGSMAESVNRRLAEQCDDTNRPHLSTGRERGRRPEQSSKGSQVNTASLLIYFFFFLVGLYSGDLAIAGGRKLLAASMFVRCARDILSE
jgi:hypothetical protein